LLHGLFSEGSGNDLKKPPLTKGGSIPDPITGELSTLPGKRVKVHPTGEVEVEEDTRMTEEDKALSKELELPKEYRKRGPKKPNEGKENAASELKKEEPEDIKDEDEEEDDGLEVDEEEEADDEDVKSEAEDGEEASEEEEFDDEMVKASEDEDSDEGEEEATYDD
jgi:hypothetical protein